MLCGPYGRISVRVDCYGSLVLVAGGIGITPMINLLGYLCANKQMGRSAALRRLKLVWIAPYLDSIAVFESVLKQATSLDDSLGLQVTLDLYVTQVRELWY